MGVFANGLNATFVIIPVKLVKIRFSLFSIPYQLEWLMAVFHDTFIFYYLIDKSSPRINPNPKIHFYEEAPPLFEGLRYLNEYEEPQETFSSWVRLHVSYKK